MEVNMKKLICEMCGGTDLIKQDGVFVCQHCGAKYSVDDAKRMMVEGTVEVTGTVKIDSSERLEKSLKNARRARDDDNHELAEKYYEEILDADPENWEGIFYNTYFKVMQCKVAEIFEAAESIKSCISSTLQCVKNHVGADDFDTVLLELSDRISTIASILLLAQLDFFNNLRANIRNNFIKETNLRLLAISMIDFTFADKVVEYFGETAITKDIVTAQYEQGLDYIQRSANNGEYIPDSIRQNYVDKLKKYKHDYQLPKYQTKKSCYVASAVYGSYNCPQVWTLRRFRDYTLVGTSYGRAFVRAYYAVSPTLVKWFGNTAWFKRICRTPLDALVKRLQAYGVENTPYEDRLWQ
jgi:uncharacterized Zn finger protein (UPF0148 family)